MKKDPVRRRIDNAVAVMTAGVAARRRHAAHLVAVDALIDIKAIAIDTKSSAIAKTALNAIERIARI